MLCNRIRRCSRWAIIIGNLHDYARLCYATLIVHNLAPPIRLLLLIFCSDLSLTKREVHLLVERFERVHYLNGFGIVIRNSPPCIGLSRDGCPHFLGIATRKHGVELVVS